MKLRRQATKKFEKAMTSSVAKESMTPLTIVVVMASSGHMPRIWTRLLFCFQTPLREICLISLSVINMALLLGALRREQSFAVFGSEFYGLVNGLGHGAR